MNTQELTEVINKYCKTESPGYAILIDGPWGIGKTHFVHQLFAEDKSIKAVHVSLFGVSSTSQVDDHVFAALIGCADVSDCEIKKAGDFIGKMFSAFGDKADGSAVGAIASLSGETLKKRALKNLNSDTVLIFDDFERSKLPPNETLAKINEFVEHQKLKVILLCDEQVIEDKQYFQTKEKVILYTNGFERSSDEIVTICFNSVNDFKCNKVDVLKAELTNIVEQFSLTNIRTIKHGLECFKDITNKIIELEPQYKGSPILSEILFSSIAFAVGYKDYGVPVSDLKKTASNSSELAVAFHMKKDEKKTDEQIKLTNWEKFYVELLGKGIHRIEFISIFELVCRGYLSVSAIKEDLKRWEGREARPDTPITHLRTDQLTSNKEFASYIDAALHILEAPDYEFYSTAELYSFCENLYFLYKHRAFSFKGNFEDKLKGFAKVAIKNCMNYTEPRAFGCKDDNDEVVKFIFEFLAKSSEEMAENEIVNGARKKLIKELKQGGVEKIVDSGDNAFSKPIIDNGVVSELMNIFPELDNVSLRSIGIFLSNRFKGKSDYVTYEDEIAPLSDRARSRTLFDQI